MTKDIPVPPSTGVGLEPCPFCQSTDQTVEQEDGRVTWAVNCNGWEDNFCGASIWGDDKASAIAAWNRRAPISPSSETENKEKAK